MDGKNIKSNFTNKIIVRFILLLSIYATCSNSVHAPKKTEKQKTKCPCLATKK